MTCNNNGGKNRCDCEIKDYKGMSKSQYWAMLLTIIVVGMLWSYAANKKRNEPKPEEIIPKIERFYPSMSTITQATFYGKPELTAKAADKVQEVFSQIEDTCNIFDKNSEISKLNASAFDKPFKCSPLLWEVLLRSRKAYDISGGTFDITAKPLMTLWGFYQKRGDSLPSEAEIKEAMVKVGLNKVTFDDQNRTVKFTVPGMSFDLGGIAKGFAVEMAAEEVTKLGIIRGVINLGGNMYCFPQPPPGKEAYTVGVRNPLNKDGLCGVIEIKKKSMATSGNYERYVTINGKQYTHIMNPKTGMPVEGMLAVTVLTAKAGDADYLSTAVFINGPEFAKKILPEFPNSSILVIRRSPRDNAKIETIKIGKGWKNIQLNNK
ncbi:MAG: FAD:protein FMN transferase [Victivallaceae bacterium]